MFAAARPGVKVKFTGITDTGWNALFTRPLA